MLIVQFQPFERILQRLIIADIIDDQTATRILKVTRDETLEPFLSGSVPKLNAVMPISIGDVFDKEINAYGSLIE